MAGAEHELRVDVASGWKLDLHVDVRVLRRAEVADERVLPDLVRCERLVRHIRPKSRARIVEGDGFSVVVVRREIWRDEMLVLHSQVESTRRAVGALIRIMSVHVDGAA